MTTETTDYDQQIAELQAEQRRVRAELRAAKRARDEAERVRKNERLLALGDRLVRGLTVHWTDASFDAAVDAVNRVLDDETVMTYLVRRTGELNSREQLEDMIGVTPDDEHQEDDDDQADDAHEARHAADDDHQADQGDHQTEGHQPWGWG